MKNADIRMEVSAAGLKLWQIADGLGIADTSFSRMLRYELPEEKKIEIRSVIKQLKEAKKE